MGYCGCPRIGHDEDEDGEAEVIKPASPKASFGLDNNTVYDVLLGTSDPEGDEGIPEHAYVEVYSPGGVSETVEDVARKFLDEVNKNDSKEKEK